MKKISISLICLIILIFNSSCSSTKDNQENSQILPETASNDIVPNQKKSMIKRQKNKIVIETNHDGDDDKIIELNQNLAFYCMKSTRKSHFKNEEECLNHVQATLDKCEKSHQTVNKSMVNCVKNSLHLR